MIKTGNFVYALKPSIVKQVWLWNIAYKNVCNIINWLMAFVPLGIRIQLDLICNKLFKSRHYV